MNKLTIRLVLWVLSGINIQAQTYRLNDFLNELEIHNPVAQQKSLVQQQTDKLLQINNVNNYPNLLLGGQATYQSDITTFPSSTIFSAPSLPLDQYKLSLDFQQNLYDGNLTKTKKNLIEAQAKVQSQKVETDLYALKQQVIQNYISILLVDKQFKVLEFAQDNLNASLRNVESLHENEMALTSDVNQIKSKLLDIESQKIQLKYQRKSFIENLETLCEKEIEDKANFEIPEYIEAPETLNRPELNRFEFQKAVNENQQQLIKAKNRPKLSLFGTGAYGRLGLNMLNPDFTPYFIGGVRLQMPLTGLYSQKNEIQNIEIQNEFIDNQKEIFNQKISLQLHQNKNEQLQLQEQLELDNQDIEFKKQILQTYKAQFQEDITLLKDYLDKIDDLEQAQLQKNIHEIQLLQNSLNRQFITGNL